MFSFPFSVMPYFAKAGWVPGRVVDKPRGYPDGHPATYLMQEFGGLKVGENGPGKTCAASAVHFHALEEPDEEMVSLAELLGSHLIGFGSDGNHASNYYCDTLGRIFVFDNLGGGLYLGGWDFGDAVERLLLGERLMPLILPSQSSVGFYGMVLQHGDERLVPLDDLKIPL